MPSATVAASAAPETRDVLVIITPKSLLSRALCNMTSLLRSVGTLELGGAQNVKRKRKQNPEPRISTNGRSARAARLYFKSLNARRPLSMPDVPTDRLGKIRSHSSNFPQLTPSRAVNTPTMI